MRRFIIASMLICLNAPWVNSQITSDSLDNFDRRISYAVGFDVVRSVSEMGINVDPVVFIRGLYDALKGDSVSPLMTREEMESTFKELQERAIKRIEDEQLALSLPNRKMGEEFTMLQLANDPNMKKTNSGLVYVELKQGRGKKPTANDVVEVKYKGYLIDGTVFDQTHEQTSSFRLTEVIPGWTEGVQLMSIGSIFKFIIPADLAYGNNPPMGTPIQPGSTLVFEIELIKITK